MKQMSYTEYLYHDAIIGIYSGSRLRRHVLLGDWHPIYMQEKQKCRAPRQFRFVLCKAKNSEKPHSYVATQPPLDTRVLSPAEYAMIQRHYSLISVTQFASENDCFAVTYEKPT